MRSVLLDLLRTIAIILLLISHVFGIFFLPFRQPFGIPNFFYITLGGLAVVIFVILSGIVLGLKYKTKKLEYFSFIKARFWRIYPTYYLALLVGIIIYFSKLIYTTKGLPIVCTVCNFTNIIGSITGFYAFLGLWGGHGEFQLPPRF